jgi:hypothetical protein
MLDRGAASRVIQVNGIMVEVGFNFLGHATIMQLDKP